MLVWSPDGKWLAVQDARASCAIAGLSLLSVETGEKRTLTVPPAAYDDSEPAFSPDGRALLFTRHGLPGRQSLWKITLSSTPRRLEPLPVAADNASALALSARGDRLLYRREMRHANLWAVDVPTDPGRKTPITPKQWSASSRGDSTP